MSGTAQAPQQAAPTGMQRIPFPTESYPHPSLPLSSKRLLNLFVESAPADSRTATPLMSSPGLLPNIVVGTGPIQAVNDQYPGHLVCRQRRTLHGVCGRRLPAWWPIALVASARPDSAIAIPFYAPDGDDRRGQRIRRDSACRRTPIPAGTMPTTAQRPGRHIPRRSLRSRRWTAIISSRRIHPTVSSSSRRFSIRWTSTRWTLRRPTRSRTTCCGWSRIAAICGCSAIAASKSGMTPGRRTFRSGAGRVACWSSRPRRIMTIGHGDGSLFWLGQQNIVYRTVGYQATRISTHGIEAKIREIGGGYTARSGYCYCAGWAHPLRAELRRADPGLRLRHQDVARTIAARPTATADGVAQWAVRLRRRRGSSPITSTDRCSWATCRGPRTTAVPIMRQAVLPPDWAGTRRAFCSRLEVEMESGGDAVAGRRDAGLVGRRRPDVDRRAADDERRVLRPSSASGSTRRGWVRSGSGCSG